MKRKPNICFIWILLNKRQHRDICVTNISKYFMIQQDVATWCQGVISHWEQSCRNKICQHCQCRHFLSELLLRSPRWKLTKKFHSLDWTKKFPVQQPRWPLNTLTGSDNCFQERRKVNRSCELINYIAGKKKKYKKFPFSGGAELCFMLRL